VEGDVWISGDAGSTWQRLEAPEALVVSTGWMVQKTMIWRFPKMVVPLQHPKMIIFSRKTNGNNMLHVDVSENSGFSPQIIH